MTGEREAVRCFYNESKVLERPGSKANILIAKSAAFPDENTCQNTLFQAVTSLLDFSLLLPFEKCRICNVFDRENE